MARPQIPQGAVLRLQAFNGRVPLCLPLGAQNGHWTHNWPRGAQLEGNLSFSTRFSKTHPFLLFANIYFTFYALLRQITHLISPDLHVVAPREWFWRDPPRRRHHLGIRECPTDDPRLTHQEGRGHHVRLRSIRFVLNGNCWIVGSFIGIMLNFVDLLMFSVFIDFFPSIFVFHFYSLHFPTLFPNHS